MSWCEVGKQVVCIADQGYYVDHVLGLPYRGPYQNQVLTIKAIQDYKPYGVNTLGLQFNEIHIMTIGGPAYFDYRCFKPTKPTNISFAKDILANTPKDKVETYEEYANQPKEID